MSNSKIDNKKTFNMLKYIILATKIWYILITRKSCLTVTVENMNKMVIIVVELN